MSPSGPEVPGEPEEGALRPESPSDSSGRDGESEWARRRRLAAVFGDVLPEQTADDAPAKGGKGDDWYRDQVPPHHG